MNRPRPAFPRALRLGAATAATAVLAAGCTLLGDEAVDRPAGTLTPSPVAPSEADPAVPAGLERFYDQELDWADCGADECASLTVPLDYDEPDGETIELSLLRVPAGDPDQRIGSLVVNPGGPGGSGVDYARNAGAFFGDELLRVFDIVGFDPRGVGRSNPVDCLTDVQLDVLVAADPDPDTPAEREQADQLLREFGEGCVERSGDLAEHVSTEEAARDVDILRSALGDPKLSWFGASYGTFLGATYADLFPERVGRMVLDGALDPSLSPLQLNLVQARGFETALRSYVRACVRRGSCFLGDSVDEGTRRIRAFLDRVEREPIDAGDRQLAVGNAVLGIWAPLYDQTYWTLLDTALRAAFDGDGRTLLALSDAYTSRGPGGYQDNSLEALYAVNCLDDDGSIPTEEAAGFVPRFEKASPTFGAIFAYGLSSCSQWPVTGDGAPGRLDAAGAPPILVIGTTRDPATPLEWAEALAEQLESGVLVRRDGDGHTGYLAGNDCVDRTVEEYLVSGTVPAGTVDC